MHLQQYWNSLDNEQKIMLNTMHWDILHKQEDITTPYAQEILSFIANNPHQAPVFTIPNIDEDLNLLNKIGISNNYDEDIIPNLFNKIVKSSNETYLAKHFYHNFNNRLTENYIKQHFKIPTAIHPVFTRANTILDNALIDPALFDNFVTLYLENKKILASYTFNTSSLYLKSDNSIINDEIFSMNNTLDLKNVTAKTMPQDVSNAVDFLRKQQDDYFKKLADFFIKHPKIYHEKIDKKIPPIFLFLTKSSGEFEYYLKFNEEHITLLMEQNKNIQYTQFVKHFFSGPLSTWNNNDLTINYLKQLYDKNLSPTVLNNFIASSAALYNDLVANKKIAHNELYEKYLENLFKDASSALKDIHLLFKKQRFEHLIENIEIINQPKKILKI